MLLDSNVIIAILTEAHEHHAASLALLTRRPPLVCAVSAHSIAESYATLTRASDRSLFRFTSAEAWAALQSLRAVALLVGLTPSQTFDAIGAYAANGGVGPRLYDALIGQAAVAHGIPAIVTWNIRHMAGLFPELLVATPTSFLAQWRG
ncbi:MAG: type II toxin-antitoxin system VapC family toxin [Acetobacteraceae bacterium]